MTTVQLSLLEFAMRQDGQTVASALETAVRTAVVADELGFRRVWVAEHHRIPAFPTPSPAVMIGHIASATRRVRVGAGGVLLGNHRALDVAEQYATLEVLHPDRIDLALGRGNGTFDPAVVAALQAQPGTDPAMPHATDADAYAREVQELLALLDPATSPGPLPDGAGEPEPWLLASSAHSAALAARLGLPLVVAHHQRPENTDDAVATYQERFVPSSWLDAPRVGVSAVVLCAPDDDTAADLVRPAASVLAGDLTDAPAPLPSPEQARGRPGPSGAALRAAVGTRGACGSPETVRAGLDDLVDRTGADELFLLVPAGDAEVRARSLRLTAAALAGAGSAPVDAVRGASR